MSGAQADQYQKKRQQQSDINRLKIRQNGIQNRIGITDGVVIFQHDGLSVLQGYEMEILRIEPSVRGRIAGQFPAGIFQLLLIHIAVCNLAVLHQCPLVEMRNCFRIEYRLLVKHPFCFRQTSDCGICGHDDPHIDEDVKQEQPQDAQGRCKAAGGNQVAPEKGI